MQTRLPLDRHRKALTTFIHSGDESGFLAEKWG